MKQFLLILSPTETIWVNILKELLQQNNADVVTRDTIQEGIKLIPENDFTEIITGSFSDGDLRGPWREVWQNAAAKGMGVTLLTGETYDETTLLKLKEEGIQILSKRTFDEDKFLAERFAHSGRPESGLGLT